MGSGYGQKRWRVLAYAWDLCEIRCLCQISFSRGCPWWLYICSQLGFTSTVCLLLQVEVLGLAGFMCPSSGLLPWQEPGRLISRTRGVIPSSPVVSESWGGRRRRATPRVPAAMHGMEDTKGPGPTGRFPWEARSRRQLKGTFMDDVG
jgi:hypothetical protein